MRYDDPSQTTMYLALQDFYPKVDPSREFINNLLKDFETVDPMPNFAPPFAAWEQRFAKWLPTNAGLIRDPIDVNWEQFRIVDEKLYAFALLRYS